MARLRRPSRHRPFARQSLRSVRRPLVAGLRAARQRSRRSGGGIDPIGSTACADSDCRPRQRCTAVDPEGAPAELTAIVTTTWAFGYFSTDERSEFVDLLRVASEHLPLAWISAENPAVVGELDQPDPRTAATASASRSSSTGARPPAVSPASNHTANGWNGSRRQLFHDASLPSPARARDPAVSVVDGSRAAR